MPLAFFQGHGYAQRIGQHPPKIRIFLERELLVQSVAYYRTAVPRLNVCSGSILLKNSSSGLSD
jgi:hypothetical protein